MEDLELEQMRAFFEGNQLNMNCLGIPFTLKISRDDKFGDRIYLQIIYTSVCSKSKKLETYKGRKFYLSVHMTADEVMKTAYLAFETAVKHEILEGFQIRGTPLFNPHTPYNELIKISHIEKRRNYVETIEQRSLKE